MSAPIADPAVDPVAARPIPPAPWVAVCRLADLLTERGAAALVHGEQVALFRLADGTVRAVQQQDPFTGSHVMSRGLVGTRGDRPTVASPLHKQVFDLTDGTCLEPAGGPALRVWEVRLDQGVVLVGGGAP
jgi:nitrite reductase (NADH) small subunit